MFQHKNEVIDGYCTAIGRDPATIERSVQLQVSPDDWETTRNQAQNFIAAGATHLIMGLRPPYPEKIVQRLVDEVVEPLTAAHNKAQ